MNVNKCSTKENPKPEALSWAQIKAAEGIYKPSDRCSDDCRLIVLKNSYSEGVTVLHFTGTALYFSSTEWMCTFERMDETLCVELSRGR